MNVQEREAAIAALGNKEALSVLIALPQKLDPTLPASEVEQKEALAALLKQEQKANLPTNITLDEQQNGDAARSLLLIIAQTSMDAEQQKKFDVLLAFPPEPPLGFLPLAAIPLIAGSIALLYVVGHLQFSRSGEGKWSFSYDPTKKTPMDESMKDIIKIMAKVTGMSS